MIEGLRATYQKYGMVQIKTALIKIIKEDNYIYVSNGGNNMYRERIKENISSSEVFNIINNIINVKPYMKFFKLEDKINAFCNKLFSNDLPFLLDDICKVTLSNYSEFQVQRALEEFIKSGKVDYFSRFKDGNTDVNYRDKLKMFDRKSFPRVIISALNNKGIDTRNIPYQDICKTYAKALAQEQITL